MQRAQNYPIGSISTTYFYTNCSLPLRSIFNLKNRFKDVWAFLETQKSFLKIFRFAQNKIKKKSIWYTIWPLLMCIWEYCVYVQKKSWIQSTLYLKKRTTQKTNKKQIKKFILINNGEADKRFLKFHPVTHSKQQKSRELKFNKTKIFFCRTKN